MLRNIKTIVPIVIILVAAFLRFYRFEEFVTFLGDQGRDAIIIKRIVTFEHWPAIGAPSSLGQIFLGPFYYYFISPFLLLFNFNPLGLAFGVALLTLLGITLAFFIIKKEFNYLTALIFLIFTTFSIVSIQGSRFSWNPNLLPIFSFFSLYFLYKSLTEKNNIFAFAFGSFLAFSVQLHHLSFLLFIPILLIYIYQLVRHSGERSDSRIVARKKQRLWTQLRQGYDGRASQSDITNLVISFAAFIFFSLPLIIFDLRHDFLNSKSFIRFFSEGNPTDNNQFLNRLLETNNAFYTHIFQMTVIPYLTLLATILMIMFLLYKLRQENNLFLLINFLAGLLYLISFSLFNTQRIAHYYNPIYLSSFLILAWTLSNLTKNKIINYLFIVVVLTSYISLNLQSTKYLFHSRGNNQLKNAEKIAESILKQKPEVPYQTVALPYVETDGHIRYFLEIKGKKPLPSDTLADPKDLYVLCFEKDPNAQDGWCQVLGNAQWQIAAFRNAKIDKTWITEGVKIYKLIH